MLERLARPGLAIDLGTAATRMHCPLRVQPLSRPSVIWRGGAPRPALCGGVVVDSEVAAGVVAELLRKAPRRVLGRRPRVLVCAPSDASEAERGALEQAVRRAGAAQVAVVPEPLAAAVGAGLAVDASRAQVLVDLGEGVTDCAVVRSGRLVATDALRLGVADLRAAVRAWLVEGAGLRLGEIEAERALRAAGVAPGRHARRRVHVVGSPCRGPGPTRAWIDVEPLHAAIDPVVDRIMARIGAFVATQAEALGPDLLDAGVCLSGGGALLGGMVERVVGELGVAVWRAPDPLLAVVDGARAIAAGTAAVAVVWR